jgi:pilus assembly protein CpaE
MQPPAKIRVLIVDDIPETRDNLRKLLQFESDIEVVGQASTGEEAIELANQTRPHIVLMDINMPGLDGIGASEAITRQVPSAQIIMMSVQSESDYLRRSMLAGARDFLSKPFSSDELLSTIRRVHERGQRMAPPTPTVEDSAAGARVGTRHGRRGKQGNVITVFSSKGGTGRSVVAVNLAIALAEMGRRTAIVDANLAFGDVGVLLDVSGTHSIVDLAQRSEEMDADLVGSVLTAHGSGLKVLLAPPRPEMGELVTADHLQQVLAALCQRFDYVVVDTFTSLQDVMLATFDMASRIILVTTPDIPSIKDSRLFFEVIDQLEYEREKTILVLNRVDKRNGISAQDVENTLKHPVMISIPEDERTVMFSVNQGVPFVLRDGGKPVAAAVKDLAGRLCEVLEKMPEEDEAAEAEMAGRSRLSRLFSSR